MASKSAILYAFCFSSEFKVILSYQELEANLCYMRDYIRECGEGGSESSIVSLLSGQLGFFKVQFFELKIGLMCSLRG